MGRFIILFFGLCMVPILTIGTVSAKNTVSDYLKAGDRLCATKDYVKAAKYYLAAVKLDAGSSAAYLGLGNCYSSVGHKSDAMTAYQKALKLDPNNVQLVSLVQNSTDIQPSDADKENIMAVTKNLASYDQPVFKQIEIDLMGGIAFTSLQKEVGAQVAYGGTVEGYYLLDPQFGVGCSINDHFISYADWQWVDAEYGPSYAYDITLYYLDILAVGKYRLGTKGLRPYVLGGVGISIVTTSTIISIEDSSNFNKTYVSTNSVSSSYPAIMGGIGLELPLSAYSNLFLQGKSTFIFTTGSNTFLAPLEAGVNIFF